MHSFLYKGTESKLFRDDAEYEQALKDGWTDAPGKESEGTKVEKKKQTSKPTDINAGQTKAN